MTKEEILEKSRDENAGRDIDDIDVQRSAARVAYFGSLVLCAGVSILQFILKKRVSVQCWIVFFGMLAIAFSVKYFKRKKLHELFVAIGYFLIFASLVVAFIFELTGRFGGES